MSGSSTPTNQHRQRRTGLEMLQSQHLPPSVRPEPKVSPAPPQPPVVVSVQPTRLMPMTDAYYMKAMQSAASYNTSLRLERKMRMPFLDSQTGVCQNHSNLWMAPKYRQPGKEKTQLYTYPAKRWHKKRHLPLYPDSETIARAREKALEAEENALPAKRLRSTLNTGGRNTPELSAEASKREQDESSQDVPLAEPIHYKDDYYDEWDDMRDPPDAGEIDDRNSDSSDFEETYVKKRKKKGRKPGPGRGRKSAGKDDKVLDDSEKPYACDTCGARYKTRPGLSYHLTHAHQDLTDEEDNLAPSPKIPTPTPVVEESSEPKPIKRSTYCDFCLGNETDNKKTGLNENLVTCADCGRSGHPTCLQFTPNMVISVAKYPWQCIECKSCGLCGTSDNDDQLLFCDDCDRGYHMYCLNPPLQEPPEGSWSCHLCIMEFYGGSKPDNGAPGTVPGGIPQPTEQEQDEEEEEEEEGGQQAQEGQGQGGMEQEARLENVQHEGN